MQEQNLPPSQNMGYEPEFKTLIDEVKLPSKGLFYPPNENGEFIDSIYIEYMTALDEELLQTPSLIKNGQAFNILLKRKIKTKGINVNDLLVGDKNAILIDLRMTSYGQYYPVTVTDPETGNDFQETVDLTKLKHKEMIHKPQQINGEYLWEYVFNLNGKQHIALVTLLRASEEEEITKRVTEKRTRGDWTASYKLERYKKQIKSLDDNNDAGRIESFLKCLPYKEGKKFDKFIDEIEPALDMMYEFTSPETGLRFQGKVYLGAGLFYPES